MDLETHIKEAQSMEYIHHYVSPLGGITMASNGDALTGLWFDGQKLFSEMLPERHMEKDLSVFVQTGRWLETYFSGKAPDFTPPLHAAGSAFQTEIWDTLLTIPFGRTMTYGEIAGLIARRHGLQHMSAQAVGGAVGRNPVSIIIPCHRVIGSNGALTGYAGGIERKKWLLEMESRYRPQ